MLVYYMFNSIIFLTNTMFFHKFLHIYQLKDYNNIRYFKYFFNIKSLFFTLCLIMFFCELIFESIVLYIFTNILLYILNFIYLKILIKTLKTPLKITNKLSRLFVIGILILFLISFYKSAFLLIILITPLLPVLANFVNIYDKLKNRNFIKTAQNKLKNHPTKIIAITGSNGKTSVKNILLKMLSTQYKVQASPASYNTPLGIAKFINNDLKFDTEFLIFEYGARHKNDIKKLCNLYGADFGIITTISGQHLESFKSIENIFNAKKELSKALQNKPCVFNIDNLYTKRMFDEKTGDKISVSTNQMADVFALNIKIKNFKTYFQIHINNEVFSLKTNLLGHHNVSNICLSSALASHLEISTENVVYAIENLEQVPHRLSLTQTHINILDDSYNCSPLSAKESLLVLKQFPNKKMVVTPGIIECGKEKFNINFSLGKELSYFDYIVIVGNENKQSISLGIKKEIQETNLKPQILFANTLDDAKHHFAKLNTGDTLLLLNDLPDDYK